MRGVYTANIEITGLSSAKTVLLLQAPSTGVLEILSVRLSNLNNETNQQWSVGLYHVTTVGSPAGTSITPEKHEKLDSSSSATALGNLSSEPSTYATKPIDQDGPASLSGYRYDPLPEERPICPPSGAIGLRMLTTPDSVNVSAQVVYREIG